MCESYNAVLGPIEKQLLPVDKSSNLNFAYGHKDVMKE